MHSWKRGRLMIYSLSQRCVLLWRKDFLNRFDSGNLPGLNVYHICVTHRYTAAFVSTHSRSASPLICISRQNIWCIVWDKHSMMLVKVLYQTKTNTFTQFLAARTTINAPPLYAESWFIMLWAKASMSFGSVVMSPFFQFFIFPNAWTHFWQLLNKQKPSKPFFGGVTV